MDRIALFLFVCGLLMAPAASAEQVATIQNRRLRVQFSRINGGLKSFTVLSSGDDYLKATAATPPPFSLTVGDPDGKRQGEACPAQAVVTVEGGTATIRSNSVLLGDENVPISAEVKVELQPDTAETRWTIHLDNRSQTRTVFSVTLPRLNGVRLGANWQDDALYFPFWGGERFPHAVSDFALIGERRLPALEMGNARVTKVGDRYVHEIHYTGGASMMWMDYADASQGLYVASYDPVSSAKSPYAHEKVQMSRAPLT
ncbi:MAG: hypothetical protein WCC59_07730 [Terriglobales bacterium]